jgi:hypothetical protein
MSQNDSQYEHCPYATCSPSADNPLEMFSIIRDDFAYRVQRRLGLIPANGLGIVRRAIFWSMVAWLPTIIWAFFSGLLTRHVTNEPLLGHFGIHVRFLVGVPLLIIAGGVVHSAMYRLLPQFVTAGIVPTQELPRLRHIVSNISNLRSASIPWLIIFSLVAARATVGDVLHHAHEIEWAVTGAGANARFGFGAWWFLYVGRPIYLTLQLAWIWRVILIFLLFQRIAGLKLSLIPTHPDRAGGLGFLAGFPGAFAPIMLATTVVLAGMFAHDVVYHGVSVQSLYGEMGTLVAILILLFLSPMLAFSCILARARRRALLDYGALVSRHGRLVHQRWIDKQNILEDRVLDAPELGPLADVATMYELVKDMRSIPLAKSSVTPLVLAAAIPMLAVLAIQIPIGDLLETLLRALV